MLLSRRRGAERMGHDYASRAHAAARLADLLGYAYAGDYRERRRLAEGHAYFVPDDTLHADDAARVGVRSDRDLFGGVAPHAFVATKALTHGTVSPEAHAPAGWVPALAAQLDDAVLYGYTAFARDDARLAARRVLERGRARLKRAVGTGGAGQTVVADADEFDAALAAVDDAELEACGVVVEQNLEEAITYSIGHLHVGGRRIAYYGTQHTVRNHHGHDVYGGSELVVMRDGAGPLERADMPEVVRTALAKARRYEAAVVRAFPRFFASRHNYDVACGRDADDGVHVGVLEQSWRFGGASAAEIAALHVFERDPRLHLVRASTHEVYADVEPPPGAIVSFRGTDPNVGRMTKYSLVDVHGHPA